MLQLTGRAHTGRALKLHVHVPRAHGLRARGLCAHGPRAHWSACSWVYIKWTFIINERMFVSNELCTASQQCLQTLIELCTINEPLVNNDGHQTIIIIVWFRHFNCVSLTEREQQLTLHNQRTIILLDGKLNNIT